MNYNLAYVHYLTHDIPPPACICNQSYNAVMRVTSLLGAGTTVCYNNKEAANNYILTITL